MTTVVRTKLVIFDLDGTLVDSARDIALSVGELLTELGRPPLPLEQIRGYIGEGVRKLLERALRASADGAAPSEEALDVAYARYLPIYRRRLLDHTRPFPGVVEALEALRGTGAALVVLSNKPRRESRELLSGLGLSGHFQAIEGGDSFARRKPDPMGARELVARFAARPSASLFVGDSDIDLRTARGAGIPCCLVRYGGAGGVSGLEPDFFVEDLRDLVPIVNASSTW